MKLVGYFGTAKGKKQTKEVAKAAFVNAGHFYADLSGYKIHEKKYHKKHSKKLKHKKQPVILYPTKYGYVPIHMTHPSKHHRKHHHKKESREPQPFFPNL